jgi:hypothetical protein
MKNKNDYFSSVIQGSIFVLSFFISQYYYVPLIFILTITVVFSILNKLGRGIVLRELIGLHGCIFCLLMPLLGYEWYTNSNLLSRLWVTYMPVTDTVYFSFALPAMAGFITALCWPINKRNISDEGIYISVYLERAKKALVIHPHIGLVFIITGIFFLYIGPYLPESLQYPANLLYTSSYAGFLYIYFNKTLRYRKIAILLFAVFICAKALGGMFTEIAYMSVTIFSFFFIGKKTAMWKKTLIFFLGIFFLVILQSVKLSYRKVVWEKKGFNDSKAVLFSTIAADKLGNASSLLNADAFFPVYVRFNQGFNVALVIKQFTLYKTYDNGSQLFFNAASSFVPRFLWPDKPASGGKVNMLYYAGYKLNNWSTNVGPLGEAYGSFGVTGGIFYMFFLGLFIRWAYQYFFIVSKNLPLLLFWMPLLFFQITYSLETDTLQILNSLIKAGFFIWLLVKLLPWMFGVVKKETVKRRILKTSLE